MAGWRGCGLWLLVAAAAVAAAAPIGPLPANRWVFVEPGFPASRIAALTARTPSGAFWVCGGSAHGWEALPFDKCWEMNMTTKHWTSYDSGPSAPAPRSLPNWVAMGQRVLMFGGVTLWSERVRFLPTNASRPIAVEDGMHMYDLSARQWSRLSGVGFPRGRPWFGGRSLADGSVWYLVGGAECVDATCAGGWQGTSAVFRLSTLAAVPQWEEVAAGVAGEWRTQSALGLWGRTLFSYGGQRNETAFWPGVHALSLDAPSPVWREVLPRIFFFNGTAWLPHVNTTAGFYYQNGSRLCVLGGESEVHNVHMHYVELDMEQLLLANVSSGSNDSEAAVAASSMTLVLVDPPNPDERTRVEQLLPSPRAFMSGLFLPERGEALIFSGYCRIRGGTRSLNAEREVHNDWYAWDAVRRVWREESSSAFHPRLRRNHGVCRYSGTQLFMFCGKDGTDTWHNDAWMFDVTTGSWERLAPTVFYTPDNGVPDHRDEVAMHCTGSDEVYIFGGETRYTTLPTQNVVVFNVTSRQWRFPPLPPSGPAAPSLYATFAVSPAPRDVWITHGTQKANHQKRNDTWRYNVSSNTWEIAATEGVIPQSRENGFGVEVNGQLFLIGGDTDSGPDNRVYALNLTTRKWVEARMQYTQGPVQPTLRDYAFDLVGDRLFVDAANGFFVLNLVDLRITAVTLPEDRFPSGALRRFRRTRHALNFFPDAGVMCLFYGFASTSEGYLSDMWCLNFTGYCAGTQRFELSDAAPVAVVRDGSYADRYLAGTRCSYELVETSAARRAEITFLEMDLGLGDWVAVWDTSANESAPSLIFNFTGAWTAAELHELGALRASGQRLRVEFASRRDSARQGEGFLGVSSARCPPGSAGDPNNSTCVPCAPGTFSALPGAAQCTTCPPGLYQTAANSTRCEVCPNGSQTVSPRVCALCARGTYSDSANGTRGNPSCQRCDQTSYAANEGAVACVACPADSWVGFFGATDASDCRCRPGFYLPEGVAPNATLLPSGVDQCRPCPPGAQCAGGGSQPAALPGYFRAAFDVFVDCPLPRLCEGGAQSACARGQRGYRCASCDEGYAQHGRECVECPENPVGPLLAALAIGILLALLFVITLRYVRRPVESLGEQERVDDTEALRRRWSSGSLAILLDFLQVTWLLSLIAVEWPGSTLVLFRVGGVFNFDVRYFFLGCTFRVNYWGGWLWRLFSPALYIAVSLLVLLATYTIEYAFSRGPRVRPELRGRGGFVAADGRRSEVVAVRSRSDLSLASAPSPAHSAASSHNSLDSLADQARPLQPPQQQPPQQQSPQQSPVAGGSAEPWQAGTWPEYCRLRFKQDWLSYAASLIFVADLAFAFLAEAALQLFACQEDALGDRHLTSAPDRRCFDSDWWRHLAPAIIFTLLYAVGIPAFFLVNFWRFRFRTNDRRFIALFGRVIFPYHPRLYFWSAVRTLRKLILVVVLTFLVNNFSVATMVLLVMLSGLTLVEAALWPYKLRSNNVSELTISVGLFLLLVLGVLFFSSLTNNLAPERAVVADFMIALVACCLAVAVAAVIVELFFLKRDPGRVERSYSAHPLRLRTSRIDGTVLSSQPADAALDDAQPADAALDDAQPAVELQAAPQRAARRRAAARDDDDDSDARAALVDKPGIDGAAAAPPPATATLAALRARVLSLRDALSRESD